MKLLAIISAVLLAGTGASSAKALDYADCVGTQRGWVEGDPVKVTQSMTLNPACTYKNLYFEINGNGETPVVFDCNGATLVGPGRGVSVTKNTAIMVKKSSPGAALKEPVVKNCNIRSFERGVQVENTRTAAFRDGVDAIWRPNVGHDNFTTYARKVSQAEPWYDERRLNSPEGVQILSVHTSDTNNAIYIGAAVVGAKVYFSTIEQTTNGIYLEYSSTRNVIAFNTISGQGGDYGAIMVDSSSRNLIVGNTIRNSGIYLYKNCYETQGNVPDYYASPRTQHSYNNWITNNTFESPANLPFAFSFTAANAGVYVGARQSRDCYPMECLDPYYLKKTYPIKNPDTYYRDRAEGTVIENNEFRQGSRVIVADDGAVVRNNKFSLAGTSASFTMPYITIGDNIRKEYGEPIVRTVAYGNTSNGVALTAQEEAYGNAERQRPAAKRDVDGDGTSDIMCHNRSDGRVSVKYSARSMTGQGPLPYSSTDNFCTHPGAQIHFGDFNGDGRSDVLCHDKTNGNKWVRTADAFGEYSNTWFSAMNFCNHAAGQLLVGDFNGDLRDDLLCHGTDNGDKWVALADRDGHFSSWSYAPNGFCSHPEGRLMIGDFDGDRRADHLCHDVVTGKKWIAFADQNGQFNAPRYWTGTDPFCVHPGAQLLLGDFNGDARTDMLCHDQNTGAKWIMYSNSQGYPVANAWYTSTPFCSHASTLSLVVGDYNGDGRSDMLCRDIYGYYWFNTADSAGHFGSSNRYDPSGFCPALSDYVY